VVGSSNLLAPTNKLEDLQDFWGSFLFWSRRFAATRIQRAAKNNNQNFIEDLSEVENREAIHQSLYINAG
jgi:hypothetical protein